MLDTFNQDFTILAYINLTVIVNLQTYFNKVFTGKGAIGRLKARYLQLSKDWDYHKSSTQGLQFIKISKNLHTHVR